MPLYLPSYTTHASVAPTVERRPCKLTVAGSIPVTGSLDPQLRKVPVGLFLFTNGNGDVLMTPEELATSIYRTNESYYQHLLMVAKAKASMLLSIPSLRQSVENEHGEIDHTRLAQALSPNPSVAHSTIITLRNEQVLTPGEHGGYTTKQV